MTVASPFILSATKTVGGSAPVLTGQKTYTHDDLNRLVKKERSGDTDVTWQYDLVGNWTVTNQNGSSETRTVNNDNEYATITGTTVTYDARGNLTSQGDYDYVYDWANRLIEVKLNDTSVATYTYDALNRRIWKTLTATSTRTIYAYDGSEVVQEYEGSSANAFPTGFTLERTFVLGMSIDQPLCLIDEDAAGDPAYYYIRDRLGSIIALLDDEGDVVERYEYSSYGRMTVYDANSQTVTDTAYGNP